MLTYKVPSISYCTYILKNCKPLKLLICRLSEIKLPGITVFLICYWFSLECFWGKKKKWQSCRTNGRSQFYLVDNLIMQQLTTTFLLLSPAFLWELLLNDGIFRGLNCPPESSNLYWSDSQRFWAPQVAERSPDALRQFWLCFTSFRDWRVCGKNIQHITDLPFVYSHCAIHSPDTELSLTHL